MKKFRQRYKSFIVEGDKIASELIVYEFFNIIGIYAISDWIDSQHIALKKHTDRIHCISERDLKNISSLKTPNKVLIEVGIPTSGIDPELMADNHHLYLDNIQDPGNLGTILRIADWYGMPYVFCSANTVDLYNSKVIQASMGAFLRVKCLTKDLTEIKDSFPNIPTLGAVIDGDDIYKIEKPKSSILVIGNEGKGISEETMQIIDKKITIPKGKKGGAESLNASIATGIICSILNQGL